MSEQILDEKIEYLGHGKFTDASKSIKEVIYSLLKKYRTLSREQIVKMTGIPRTTVFDYLKELWLEDKKIYHIPIRNKKRGRPRIIWSVNPINETSKDKDDDSGTKFDEKRNRSRNPNTPNCRKFLTHFSIPLPLNFPRLSGRSTFFLECHENSLFDVLLGFKFGVLNYPFISNFFYFYFLIKWSDRTYRTRYFYLNVDLNFYKIDFFHSLFDTSR